MFRMVLSISLLFAALVPMGCVMGIKEDNTILFVSPVAIPESAKGAVLIATNEEIPLAIIGMEDKIFKQRVTGYVLVDPWTWDAMVKVYNDQSR